jgi:hypothetical protein
MDAGVTHRAPLEAVHCHHDQLDECTVSTLASGLSSEGRQAAALLRQADLFTAKLSRRGDRVAVSPLRAVPETYMTGAGTPDVLLLRPCGVSSRAAHAGHDWHLWPPVLTGNGLTFQDYPKWRAVLDGVHEVFVLL